MGIPMTQAVSIPFIANCPRPYRRPEGERLYLDGDPLRPAISSSLFDGRRTAARSRFDRCQDRDVLRLVDAVDIDDRRLTSFQQGPCFL
jgi:hypothetical protein